MDEEKYVGVIEQSPLEKELNYPFAEIVASANPVIWHTKIQPISVQFEMNSKTWRKFPVRNQDGSGSCVAQTLAKLLGILAYLKWKVFITFSASHIYMRRSNKNVGDGQGMGAVDVYKIAQQGVTFEELMPSQGMSEVQMNAVYESDLHKRVNLAINNYVFLPVGDIEKVASVIQTTLKGVMTWFKFGKGEWTAVPSVLVSKPENHHSTASVDATMYENEKSLVIDESWGNTYGFNGQRVIKESFYRERNTHASYPVDFKFETEQAPVPPSGKFTRDLVFVPLDINTQEIAPGFVTTHNIQKNDVSRLQDILKKEGLFPTNAGSTGLYQNLTRKAVKAFQIKHAVAPLKEINEVDGKRVGAKTLAVLNKLYG